MHDLHPPFCVRGESLRLIALPEARSATSQDRNRAILPCGAYVQVRRVPVSGKGRGRTDLIVKVRPERRGERSHRETRPVVLLRYVHGDHMLGPLPHDLYGSPRRLLVGEMAAIRADAILQIAWVWAASEHRGVMVGLERDDAGVPQPLAHRVRHHPGVRGVTDGISIAREAKAHGVRDVVGGRERVDDHPGELKLLARDEVVKRQFPKRAAHLGGADGCEEFHGEGAVQDGDASRMVPVLVGEDQRPDVMGAQPACPHPRKDLASREAVVDHDEAVGSGDDGAVALRSAGENVEMQSVP